MLKLKYAVAVFAVLAATAHADDSGVRTIDIDANTKWVNVTDGETVQIKANGQVFTWHVSVWPNRSSIELSKVAPEGVNVGSVRAYVAPNPLYRN